MTAAPACAWPDCFSCTLPDCERDDIMADPGSPTDPGSEGRRKLSPSPKAAYYREYYRKNRERRIEQSRRWNAAHPEVAREARRRWRAAHPGYGRKTPEQREAERERNRSYYRKHREEILARRREKRRERKGAGDDQP